MLAIRQMKRNTAPFLLKVDAALMDPLAGEVIVSGELLLQNGAAIYYPLASEKPSSAWTNWGTTSIPGTQPINSLNYTAS